MKNNNFLVAFVVILLKLFWHKKTANFKPIKQLSSTKREANVGGGGGGGKRSISKGQCHLEATSQLGANHKEAKGDQEASRLFGRERKDRHLGPHLLKFSADKAQLIEKTKQ